MMRLKNNHHLRETKLLRSVATRLLGELAPKERVVGQRIISGDELEALAAEPFWLSAGSSPIWGVAALCRGVVPLTSPLARARCTVRLAACVREEAGPGLYGDGKLILTPAGPPRGWSCIEINTSSGSVVCAGAFAALNATARVEQCRKSMQVRLFLQATSSSQVCEGACLTLGSSLWAALPEIGVVGTIQSCVEKQPISGDLCGGQFSNHKQGVIMTVTQEPQVLPASGGGIGVRIDLGSLELTVDEIAALSPGVRIELDGSFPAECFLRVGATVLARGVLEQGEGGFALRVQQVFE